MGSDVLVIISFFSLKTYKSKLKAIDMNFPKWISNFLSVVDLYFFFRIIRFAEVYEHDENISQTELAKWVCSYWEFSLLTDFVYSLNLPKLYIRP